MDMDTSEFEHFESYSAFKKRCLPISQDEVFLQKLLQSWKTDQTDSSNDRYLSKVNVLWDTGPHAQTMIVKLSGKLILKRTITRLESTLSSKN